MHPRRFLLAAFASVLISQVAYLAPAAGHGEESDHPSGGTIGVEIFDFGYTPNPVRVNPGDTVRWQNTGVEPHTVTADNGSFSLTFDPGEAKNFTFAEAGTFQYFCQIHGAPGGGGMSGTLLVGTNAAPTAKLAADDNVAASIGLSRLRFPSEATSPSVVVGRSDVFADSLASGAVQGKLNAPLLLTPPERLDDRVSAEVDRLGVRTAYLLGGQEALSPAVESALSARNIEVRRIAGSDRLETANAVAAALFADATRALVARAFAAADDPSRAFVDSLAAGSVAAREGVPILFSETGRLSASTRAHIQSSSIRNVTLVGGEAALSSQVEEDLRSLGIDVQRVAGPDRTATAAALSQRLVPIGQEPARQVVIDGSRPDAWAAGFPAAGLRAPLTLVLGDDVPAATIGFVINANPAITQLVCAPFVSATACSRVEAIASADKRVPERAAILSGAAEVPGPGHAGATGRFALYRTNDAGAFCYDGITPGLPFEQLTGVHIHAGAPGSEGPIVVPLSWQERPFGDPIGCAFGVDPARVADLFANPADYYVNFHTAEFPAGAIRGQVFLPSAVLWARLTGEAVTGEPANSAAGGLLLGLLTQDPGEICVGITFFGPAETGVAGAHVHKAAGGTAGPAVLDLAPPRGDGGPVKCYRASRDIVSEMRTVPQGYYVDVHTSGGAIRGQLVKL